MSATNLARTSPYYAATSTLARKLQSWSSFVLAKKFASIIQGAKRMRYLRQLCLIAGVTFALTFSAIAGEIECPGITTPPPQPTITSSGAIECPGLQLAVSVIQGVLLLP
jgi:hypothetical protein